MLESPNSSNGLKVKPYKSTASNSYLEILSSVQDLNHQLNKRKNCNNTPAQY